MEKKGKVILVLVLLVLLIPVSMGLRNTRAGSGIPGREIVPPTFDFENIMADILWIRTIQILGTVYRKPGAFSQEDIAKIYSLFDRIVTLNPKFTSAYEYGGLALSVCAPDYALSLLERGIANNPQAGWKLPFYAGMVANQWMKSPGRACSYFEKAKAFPDRPAYIDRVFARAASSSGDLKTALDTWKAIYKNADDQLEKGIAARGLNETADRILNESVDAVLKQEARRIKEAI